MESKLYNGPCVEMMKELRDKSVDLLLTDLPYGVLNKRTEWDKCIPYDEMWEQVNRVSKENAPFITTSKQPFTSELIFSNLKNFRYCWIWEKSKSTGYLNSKRMPLVAHEDVVVFYKKILYCLNNLNHLFHYALKHPLERAFATSKYLFLKKQVNIHAEYHHV